MRAHYEAQGIGKDNTEAPTNAAPAKPGAPKPGAPKPAAPKPAAAKPAAAKPTPAKPAAAKPAAAKPTPTKPAAAKPAAPKPASPKPATPKPEAATPAASKTAAPQPCAPKPGAEAGPTPRAASPPAGSRRLATNPFSSGGGSGDRPAPRPGGAKGPRQKPQGGKRDGQRSDNRENKPQSGGQSGGRRPSPAMMPSHPNPAAMPQKAAAAGGRGRGGRPGKGGPGAGTGAGAPGGFRSGPGGRGGRRGGTAGAFGRPGGAPRRGKKSKRQKRNEYEELRAPNVVGGVRLPDGKGESIRLRRGASLADFAEKIGADPAALVQALFNLGEMVTATASVSEETLQLLGAEINYDVQVVSPEDEDRELLESFDLQFGDDEGTEEDLAKRPPVVTVMGHVDHGKTRLLDTVRRTNEGAGEAGGITQGIGAYQTQVDIDGGERTITFLDTPGHEAFTAMRARGAKSTDLAILVVAADDGVMPQTVEAINHAKAANIPVVVAVNKIDKPEAAPDKIRGQLTEYGLVPEEYGGDTMFVDISAKAGTNIDALLEAVVLTADAALELTANPDMDAQGVSIDR